MAKDEDKIYYYTSNDVFNFWRADNNNLIWATRSVTSNDELVLCVKKRNG